MRKALFVGLMLLLVAGSAFALNAKVPIPYDRPTNGSDYISADQVVPYHPHAPSQLDEMGDTLHVGYTWYDIQHNAQDGRMIGYVPSEDEVHLIYMRGFDEASASRHVMYIQVTDATTGAPVVTAIGDNGADNGVGRSGFGTLAMDVDNNHAFPTFHHTADDGTPYASKVAVESAFVPGFFDLYANPDPTSTDNDVLFPRSVWGNTGHVHMISSDFPAGAADATKKYYMRWAYDPDGNTMTAATSDGEQVLMTEVGMNNSSDIHTSADGMHVAYTECMPRGYTIGEGDATQWNNDLWLWQSTDAGETWGEPMDVTQWIAPDELLLPDSLAADKDTMRCYMDGSVLIDNEDNIHAVFTTPNYYSFEGLITYTSRIWHWDQNSGTYTLIADGTQGYLGQPETFGLTADRPSIYQDPDTGILWVIFRRTSNAIDNPDSTDIANGYACGDIYVTASPPGEYNGLLWAEPINLTNTKWLQDADMTPGDAQSEIDPSIALTSDGDYLNFMYVVDTWPDRATDTEATNCPVVYQKVMKQDIIDSFTAWLPNYPMHIDSTGYWEDPNDYAWNGFITTSVDEGTTLQPNQFELEQNYPNPFNPSTQIAFTLKSSGKVKLAVYDVLGREVATLVNRGMSAGHHSVNFLADDLPSGVYFYKLTSGSATQVRKMVLMK